MSEIKDYFFAKTDHYSGYVDPRFIHLAKQFSRLQNHRIEQGGAALAVYYRGEKVVDIFTGQKSIHEAWAEDTLSICYSTGKGVLATLAHILVSEGFVDYHSPITDYWPEFAKLEKQNGKEQLTLAQLLSHQSGLYDIRNIIAKASEMADWNHMLKVMEQAIPRFQVGTENAYQALTFGWLVGGVLEKATQKSISDLLKQYLAEPLALDGAYFGVPFNELVRTAKPLNYKTPEQRNLESKNKKAHEILTGSTHKKSKPKTDYIARAIELSGQNPEDFLDAMVPKSMRDFSFYDDATIQSVIPSANGAFTARSLAKIYAMLANKGEWGGQVLIKPNVFEELSTVQSRKRDRVMPIPMHWRLGYHRVLTLGKRVNKGFGHIGYNGSGAWCDPERQLSFAYTHNFPTGSITGDYRLWGLSQEALRCVDLLLVGKKGWF